MNSEDTISVVAENMGQLEYNTKEVFRKFAQLIMQNKDNAEVRIENVEKIIGKEFQSITGLIEQVREETNNKEVNLQICTLH